MPRLKKMLTDFANESEPQESGPEIGIKVHEESEHYKTYLIRVDKSFGFGVTVFKEEKNLDLVMEDSKVKKVVFIAVDVTGSMSGVINDVSKQISTILKLSSNLLPVKIILALYSDFESDTSDTMLVSNLNFIHVCSEEQASKALLDYWNTSVYAHGGGDSPEMNLTLMATINKYYRGIVDTEFDRHCFEVNGTDVNCPVVTGEINCAVIQISDAENRDPVANPDSFPSHNSRLEAACLKKVFNSFSKWSDVDKWCRDNNIPYISIYVGGIEWFANSRTAFRVGPSCLLLFAQVQNELSAKLGSFIVAIITCLLDMTSLGIFNRYNEDYTIPILEDQHQFQQDFVKKYGYEGLTEGLNLVAMAEVWEEKIGHIPGYTSGKVTLENLGVDDRKNEHYFNLCMEVARSDYFSVMISNPVFAEVVTALKTTWNHKQVQDFNNSMSERLNMCSEEEKESYSKWRDSGKTLGGSTVALINQLIITPLEDDAEFEIVRLKDETARDTKSVSEFNIQHPKCVEALYKFIKGLRVEKTTKVALKPDLEQYTLKKGSDTTTFAPVIDLSALPETVVAEAESEKNETFNLDALELRGIMRLYNSRLYLMGMSLTSFAMMCVICSRRSKHSRCIGKMGEKYLASLRTKGVNFLKDKYSTGKIKPEACGALYSMVIRPFWELHADKANVRDNMLTRSCWRYMNIMAVMHLGVYNDVKLPVLEMKKSLECRHFSVLPSMLQLSDDVRSKHCVVCKLCGSYKFRGATPKDVCVMCMYADYLVFKCKTARNDAPDSKEMSRTNCLQESNMRCDFNGEMYCKKCCLYDNEGLKKQTISFLVCGKCSSTYALSGDKDLKRTAVCFVCIFVDTLKLKFKNAQELESFLGDMSNPSLMVIQMDIVNACEEGNAHLADKKKYWGWLKETLEARQASSRIDLTNKMGQQFHKHSENILRKLCGMKVTGDKEKDDMQSQDLKQNLERQAAVPARLPRRRKKITRAQKRKEFKTHAKNLPYDERLEHLDKRREKRRKRRDIIAEKKAKQEEALKSSVFENLLRKVRDTFTRTCQECKMSVVCSPESMWQGCLVCDGLVDPITSSFFQQVQKPLSDVVTVDVLNTVVLTDIGIKLSGESWKDLKKASSIGQFFRFIEIQSFDDSEKMEVDKEVAVYEKQNRLDKVNFCGNPFNFKFIYSHLLMLKTGLEGKDLTSKKINEMKGVCLICGDPANYMYSLHKEGNCSGMVCRLCATRYYWSVIKEAYSSTTNLSRWLSCMFCRQLSSNMRNIWVWIGVKHNVINAIEDISEEESTFFRGVLNSLSEGMFEKLSQEFEDSPNAIYNICHKCLQLKHMPENQIAAPVACGAPEPAEVNVIKFVCEDCSKLMVTAAVPMDASDTYPTNTIEAALFKLQSASSADTGPETISSKEVVRQCPACKHDIVKDGGCLVMYCPVQNCRTEFCFICGHQSDENGSTYTHLSNVHNLTYFGDLSEDDFPVLTLELVQTASGSQYLYVFDSSKYYFDTVTMKLENHRP